MVIASASSPLGCLLGVCLIFTLWALIEQRLLSSSHRWSYVPFSTLLFPVLPRRRCSTKQALAKTGGILSSFSALWDRVVSSKPTRHHSKLCAAVIYTLHLPKHSPDLMHITDVFKVERRCSGGQQLAALTSAFPWVFATYILHPFTSHCDPFAGSNHGRHTPAIVTQLILWVLCVVSVVAAYSPKPPPELRGPRCEVDHSEVWWNKCREVCGEDC